MGYVGVGRRRTITCPHCGEPRDTAAHPAMRLRCSKCNNVWRVPAAGDAGVPEGTPAEDAQQAPEPTGDDGAESPAGTAAPPAATAPGGVRIERAGSVQVRQTARPRPRAGETKPAGETEPARADGGDATRSSAVVDGDSSRDTAQRAAERGRRGGTSTGYYKRRVRRSA